MGRSVEFQEAVPLKTCEVEFKCIPHPLRCEVAVFFKYRFKTSFLMKIYPVVVDYSYDPPGEWQ